MSPCCNGLSDDDEGTAAKREVGPSSADTSPCEVVGGEVFDKETGGSDEPE